MPESADGDLAQRDGAAADGDVLLVDLGFAVRAASLERDLGPLAVGEPFQLGGEAGGAGAQGDECQIGGMQLGQAGAGGDFAVEDEQFGRVAGRGLPVPCERDHLAGLVGLGARGVGVDEVVGLPVVGEEREDRLGALRATRDVMCLQRNVLTEMHDRVDICRAPASPRWRTRWPAIPSTRSPPGQ